MSQLSDRLIKTAASFSSFSKGRLISLDVFRGITIALMILVNNPGGSVYYAPLQHADWNGWTLADLVFPFFLFIVGVAIPYALGNRIDRGETTKKLLLRVTRRTLILFALGLFLNGFPFFDFSTLRIMGVLQRIALCYFFASIIFLAFKTKKQAATIVFLSLFYWALMVLVPVPGYGPGVLEKEGNLAAWVDNIVLGRGHLWGTSVTWDPEGLLSTMPAIATTLIGVLAGECLRSSRKPREKSTNLFLSGVLLIAVGTLWNLWFPINKSLWTSSYVAFTGGIGLILLATCYFIVDVKNHVKWTKPFVALGLNAIILYVLSEIVNLAFINATVSNADGTSIALKTAIYENLFASWAGQLNGSLFYAVAYLMLWLGVAAVLYRLRIFIKI